MLTRTDPDTVETGEWIDSLRAVLHRQGPERAAFLLEKLTDEAQHAGVAAPLTLNTPYINTILPEREERAKSAHIMTPSSTVRRIVNMTAVAVADAGANREGL